MTDTGDNPRRSFADRARSVLSNVEQDDRFKQAAAATKDAAQRAQEASKSVSRKVSQEDAWDEQEHRMIAVEETAAAPRPPLEVTIVL